MTIKYPCTIPSTSGSQLTLELETGRAVIIIGANGSGKTRLGVHMERSVQAQQVHRIPAHKSLLLNDHISLVSFERAQSTLRYGHDGGDPNTKEGSRWQSRATVHLMNDFDPLLQSLFAQQNRVSTQHLQARMAKPDIPVPTTKLIQLRQIWDDLLPHRRLEISDADIQVRSSMDGASLYPGSEMSDGERAIFYFMGQCLMQPPNCAIIVDEPEAHVHKAVLGPLWDAIEKARPDCAFAYITHDLDFAVTRTAAAKYFVRAYTRGPETWDIAPIPVDTGLPERVVAELVGSRKPVLFVEGERGSRDLTIYRHQYARFTIMPVGSCHAVIHSVMSYNNSDTLHRYDAHGLVDRDERTGDVIVCLRAKNVDVLPVAEVENLLLLPEVFRALAEALACSDIEARLNNLKVSVMEVARKNLDQVSARYATRQLDRRLKEVTVRAKDLATLEASYRTEMATIEPASLFSSFKARLEQGIDSNDLATVLALYDNKGLLAVAAETLGIRGPVELMEKVGKLLGTAVGEKLRQELGKVLPIIAA